MKANRRYHTFMRVTYRNQFIQILLHGIRKVTIWWPNQDKDAIDIVVGIDKGGGSTKLQVMWLNSLQPQASHASKLLGMYEGPEKYEMVSECYRQLLSQFAGNWYFPWRLVNLHIQIHLVIIIW